LVLLHTSNQCMGSGKRKANRRRGFNHRARGTPRAPPNKKKNKGGHDNEAKQPKRRRKTEAETLLPDGPALCLAKSEIDAARLAADAVVQAARANLTSTFTKDGFRGLVFPGMRESDTEILSSPVALKEHLSSLAWDTWPSKVEGTTMSSRLHFGRPRIVRRETLYPKYNWGSMVSATEAFCRPAPPVIEVLMRAVGVAVAKEFPDEFKEIQSAGGVKPEDCRWSVTVTCMGVGATEILLRGKGVRSSCACALCGTCGPCTLKVMRKRGSVWYNADRAPSQTRPPLLTLPHSPCYCPLASPIAPLSPSPPPHPPPPPSSNPPPPPSALLVRRLSDFTSVLINGYTGIQKIPPHQDL
jgi:hypothetical protein